MFALALGDVYTFGPTFRAENSNTRRHAAEFWMVEPEMAFCNLECNMDLAEELVKYLTTYVMEECKDDLALFAKFVDTGLMATLENTAFSDYVRLPYAEAVDILSKFGKKFEYEIVFGKDLQSEHERFLTEKHFKKPVIVFDYPKGIKPFYMRLNWMYWSPGWRKWGYQKQITGGISRPANTVRLNTAVLDWDSNDCSCW
jgi:asparaginyl-tRNA synthetase